MLCGVSEVCLIFPIFPIFPDFLRFSGIILIFGNYFDFCKSKIPKKPGNAQNRRNNPQKIALRTDGPGLLSPAKSLLFPSPRGIDNNRVFVGFSKKQCFFPFFAVDGSKSKADGGGAQKATSGSVPRVVRERYELLRVVKVSPGCVKKKEEKKVRFRATKKVSKSCKTIVDC